MLVWLIWYGKGIQVNGTDTRALAAELAALIGQQAVTPLLDASQGAALLNVPPSWLLALARAGRIPHVRLGRYVAFTARNCLPGLIVGRRGHDAAGTVVEC